MPGPFFYGPEYFSLWRRWNNKHEARSSGIPGNSCGIAKSASSISTRSPHAFFSAQIICANLHQCRAIAAVCGFGSAQLSQSQIFMTSEAFRLPPQKALPLPPKAAFGRNISSTSRAPLAAITLASFPGRGTIDGREAHEDTLELVFGNKRQISVHPPGMNFGSVVLRPECCHSRLRCARLWALPPAE